MIEQVEKELVEDKPLTLKEINFTKPNKPTDLTSESRSLVEGRVDKDDDAEVLSIIKALNSLPEDLFEGLDDEPVIDWKLVNVASDGHLPKGGEAGHLYSTSDSLEDFKYWTGEKYEEVLDPSVKLVGMKLLAENVSEALESVKELTTPPNIDDFLNVETMADIPKMTNPTIKYLVADTQRIVEWDTDKEEYVEMPLERSDKMAAEMLAAIGATPDGVMDKIQHFAPPLTKKKRNKPKFSGKKRTSKKKAARKAKRKNRK